MHSPELGRNDCITSSRYTHTHLISHRAVHGIFVRSLDAGYILDSRQTQSDLQTSPLSTGHARTARSSRAHAPRTRD